LRVFWPSEFLLVSDLVDFVSGHIASAHFYWIVFGVGCRSDGCHLADVEALLDFRHRLVLYLLPLLLIILTLVLEKVGISSLLVLNNFIHLLLMTLLTNLRLQNLLLELLELLLLNLELGKEELVIHLFMFLTGLREIVKKPVRVVDWLI